MNEYGQITLTKISLSSHDLSYPSVESLEAGAAKQLRLDIRKSLSQATETFPAPPLRTGY